MITIINRMEDPNQQIFKPSSIEEGDYIRIIYSKRKSELGKKIQRQRSLMENMGKRDKDKKLNSPWSRYFHSFPEILARVQNHYINDGKKVCIQYCCGNNPLLQKNNYCCASLSLL